MPLTQRHPVPHQQGQDVLPLTPRSTLGAWLPSPQPHTPVLLKEVLQQLGAPAPRCPVAARCGCLTDSANNCHVWISSSTSKGQMCSSSSHSSSLPGKQTKENGNQRAMAPLRTSPGSPQ